MATECQIDSFCKICSKKITRGKFCIPGGLACRECKISENGKQFLQDVFAEKWSQCNALGKLYFIGSLQKLYRITIQNQISLIDLLGSDIVKAHTETHLCKLLDFAKSEFENSTGDSMMDFVLVRFERHFRKDPKVLDFWLTLCIIFDMTNYLEDVSDQLKNANVVAESNDESKQQNQKRKIIDTDNDESTVTTTVKRRKLTDQTAEPTSVNVAE